MLDLLMGLVCVLLLVVTCLWFVKLYSHDPAIEPLYRAVTRLLGLFLLLWGLLWVRWLVRSSRQRKALRQQERERANANYHLDQVRRNNRQ
jgi:Na+/melibiose symporter-like transporter